MKMTYKLLLFFVIILPYRVSYSADISDFAPLEVYNSWKYKYYISSAMGTSCFKYRSITVVDSFTEKSIKKIIVSVIDTFFTDTSYQTINDIAEYCDTCYTDNDSVRCTRNTHYYTFDPWSLFFGRHSFPEDSLIKIENQNDSSYSYLIRDGGEWYLSWDGYYWSKSTYAHLYCYLENVGLISYIDIWMYSMQSAYYHNISLLYFNDKIVKTNTLIEKVLENENNVIHNPNKNKLFSNDFSIKQNKTTITVEPRNDVRIKNLLFYNSKGQKYPVQCNEGNNKYTLKCGQLSNSVYLLSIILDKGIVTKVIVINR